MLKRISRRWWIIGGILLLVVICIGIVNSLGGSMQQAALMLTPTAVPVKAERVPTAKGVFVPAQSARLAFGANGTLVKIQVKAGDRVKTGEVIARLDTRDLELQVQSAQNGLAEARAALAQLKAPATALEIAAAEAAVRQAQINYDRAKNGATPEEAVILKANLDKAEAALKQAQAAYDQIGGSSFPYIGLTPQALQLQQATLDYQIARANYEMKVRPDEATLAAAEANLATAQATLAAKKGGARPEDVAVAQARVDQAQIALAQAQLALEKARLMAPFEGTVTDWLVRENEFVTAGTPVIVIADLSRLRVETTDLDEWDTAKIQVGQKARIAVNAFSDKVLTGRVVAIALQSTVLPSGDVSYTVIVDLDQQDPEVRWGMTAKVEFEK